MICVEKDSFIEEYQERNPSWIVWLNNGLVVYQDDGRPDIEPASAWERLHNYCSKTKSYITDMDIGFRDNRYRLTSNADGYYFCKGVRMGIGTDLSYQLFYVGALKDGSLVIERWKTPEMIKELTETRDPNKAGLCLIQKSRDILLG